MDDELATPSWQLDPDTRVRLRIERVRTAVGNADWPNTVVEAEELLDEAPGHAEALMHLAVALLELGDSENAVDAFEDHLRISGPDADALSGLAIARFECCNAVGAMEAARGAIRIEAGLAEAHYTLGLALERLPDAGTEAASAFAAARTLEPQAYPWPLDLNELDVIPAFAGAMSQISPLLVKFWEPVPVRVEEEPSLEELRAHLPPLPPTVAGFYEGTPPTDREGLRLSRPTALRLFRKNLARCSSFDDVCNQIALVLEAEALDWIGAPLEELQALLDQGPQG